MRERSPKWEYKMSGFTSRKLTSDELCDVLELLIEAGFLIPCISAGKLNEAMKPKRKKVVAKKKGKGRKC